ncbi:hypothetical protein [Maribacter aquivivus]|uniref:hypothetical protein n=1 Tax=Maribacter aquivivus TaxID=228958 RepID=UPI002492761F|nr:hypothetical protein [Maribacter aquivivus]
MKSYLTILLILCCQLAVFSQVPENISYQAVIRTSDGSILANAPIGLRISVIQESASGLRVYEESHVPITNDNGLVSIHIGTGLVSIGNFAQIDWSNGPFYLETEMDLNGGSDYTVTGLTELLSVPYALHAKTASALVSSEGEYLLKSKIISVESSRDIIQNDIGNTIECTNSASLRLPLNFNAMAIGDVINLEAHNGAILTIVGASGVQLNYVVAGSAVFESKLGNVCFGLLRKMATNSYIISGQ